MNKLERMTGILLVMSRKGRIRAAELAGLFEVSERTIYRDVQALSEMGVPVIAGTGTGGGYSIEDGYFAEPVVLDTEECQAIYLGCDFIGGQRDFPLAAAARRALTKLEAVMPRGRQEEARDVLGRVVWEMKAVAPGEMPRILDLLRRGMLEKRTVDILYAPLDGEPIWRSVDVYELNYAGNAWYINGYCHLRRDMRRFKAVRVLDCRLGNEVFQRRELSAVQSRPDGPDMVVRVVAARAKILAEDPFFAPYLALGPEDAVLTLPATDFSETFVLRFVMGLGSAGELLDPPELRKRVLDEIQAVKSKYQKQS